MGARAATDASPPRLQRFGRGARWLHALVYLVTAALLATGWWLLGGHEGDPSVLARAVGLPDVVLHRYLGWGLAALGLGALLVWHRAAWHFVVDSLRHDRGDGAWLARWPAAVFTGRFPRHEGRYDPGQRIANLVLCGALLVLVASGIGLVMVHGGPAFVWLARIHEYTTYVATVVIVGHVVVASGVFPGYRGVGRSMHLGGRVTEPTARRLWPAWVEARLSEEGSGSRDRRRRD